jgi:hypothetical protein
MIKFLLDHLVTLTGLRLETWAIQHGDGDLRRTRRALGYAPNAMSCLTATHNISSRAGSFDCRY